MRRFILSLLVLIAGSFSVTIANVFGGYFSLVVVLQIVSLTMYFSSVLEEKEGLKWGLGSGPNVVFCILFSLTLS